MAQRSGLFDSTEIVQSVNGYPQGNRAETADFFARYFANFISNGVFANPSTNFKVMAQSGLTVVVRPGSCFINGYMAFDTAEETHTLTASGEAQDWYFVQRMYLPDGTITKTWVLDNTGTAVPVRTATTYDLVIALVRIPAGASVITDSMITDYRYDNDKCGIVHAAVDHIDTTELATQLNAAAQEFITAAENSLTTWQGTFDQWFNAIKNQLSGDAAGALELSKNSRAYCVVDSASTVTAKTAVLDGYYLAVGQTIYVRFVNSAPANATLNINGTGDLPIYNKDMRITAADIPAGTVAALVYNGTYYTLLNAANASGGVNYAEASGTSTATAATESGLPSTLKAGDRFSVHFADELEPGASLNINGTGAKLIINNYTGGTINDGDVPAEYLGDVVYDGAQYLLLNPLVVSGTPTGSAFFTENGTFTVPVFVTSLKISACSAGVGRYAGEYLIDAVYNVEPGQVIDITVGLGNTVIGDLATLIAGTVSSSVSTTKLGYAAGYNGGNGGSYTGGGKGGYGGAFGFGGGGGGTAYSSYLSGGGGGAGIGGAGGNNPSGASTAIGKGGGSTGGAGTKPYSSSNQVYYSGENAKSGKLIYKGADGGNGNDGGDGSIYGAGGGGNMGGGGGAAGGYGAGGGQSGGSLNGESNVYGQPSNGMVLIEWGGTVA